MDDRRVLLLQARAADDPARAHEHACFADRIGLPPTQVVCHDLVAGPPTHAQVAAFDALMVGGSGDYYVSRRDLPHFDALLRLLRDVVDGGPPTFLSCYGFGALVAALGGEMIHDPATAEIGSFDLQRTDAGAADSLFGGLPASFVAQLGHKDRVGQLPEGVLVLASSERCPVQALRIPGRPVWATQFHPELDQPANRKRLSIYAADYGPGDAAELARLAASFRPTPETAGLLARFMALI